MELKNDPLFSPEYFPQRIICLTEEPTEVLHLLGEQNRIVGISGFTVRPAKARKEKPKVSAFIDADIEKIVALKPDLVIGFSDIQANIAKELIARGISVWINNHRSVQEIFKMIVQLGSIVGKQDEAIALVNEYKFNIENIVSQNTRRKIKPKVYFEEWFDPLIIGIKWVSELVELAGGIDIYKEHQNASLAKDRIIGNMNDVVDKNPDIIIASWCGKKFKKEKLVSRKDWNKISAVKNDFIFEIKSSIILQPGPAAVSEGIREIANIIDRWHRSKS
ncbi:MAG: cobalamin-binding protein [Ginsengibacter sp.]